VYVQFKGGNKMSVVAKLRRGTVSQIQAQSISLSELQHATDTDDIYLGGNNGNVNISYDPRISKIHRGTIIGSRISVVTGKKYAYIQGNAIQFTIPQDMVAPITLVIDQGVELQVKGFDGALIDMKKDTVYLAMFTEGSPTNFFQSASRGGNGGVVVPSVSPILGKQVVVGEINDKTTPVQAVGNALSTVSDKNVVLLSDRSIVIGVSDGVNSIVFFRTTNGGNTFQRLTSMLVSATSYFSIVSNETNVYCLASAVTGGTSLIFSKFNALTVLDTPQQLISVDTNQTAFYGVSLAIGDDGVLHAVASTKNSTFPNSPNLRYSKSTNFGTTWSTPTQIGTTNSNDQYGLINPSMILNKLNNPVITLINLVGAQRYCGFIYYDGSSFVGGSGNLNPVQIAGGFMYEPKIIMSPNGDLHIVCSGLDTIDTGKRNLFYVKSSNNGLSFSTYEKLTNGNEIDRSFSRLATDNNNKIFIVYQLNTSSNNIALKEGVSGAFGIEQIIGSGGSGNNYFPSVCSNFKDFIKPITIWRDNSANAVKFYGKWGTQIINQVNLAVVEKDSFVYCNENTVIELSGGGVQNVPSVANALNENELKVSNNGLLKSQGITQKYYVGCVSKLSQGFTPL
jgi:antitoxin component of MazEF toxin-antitoxin module